MSERERERERKKDILLFLLRREEEREMTEVSRWRIIKHEGKRKRHFTHLLLSIFTLDFIW